MKLFISCAREDAPLADALERPLMLRGIEVLDATRLLSSGADIQETLAQAVAEADGFVFLIGAGRQPDRWQEREWREVLRNEWDSGESRPLIAVADEVSKVPPFLRDHAVIRFAWQGSDYSVLADRIAYLAAHPSETVRRGDPNQAQGEWEAHVTELERFASALEVEANRS